MIKNNATINWLYFILQPPKIVGTNGTRNFDSTLGWPNGWIPQQTPSYFQENHYVVSNAQGSAWSFWQANTAILGAQRIQAPSTILSSFNPGLGTQIAAGSDQNGTIQIAHIQTTDLQNSAFILVHQAGAPADSWTSQQISGTDQVVSSVDIGINLMNGRTVSYINDTSQGGQCWSKINDGPLTQISPAGHNAINAKTYISNATDSTLAAASYIHKTSPTTYRSEPVNTGAIFVSIYTTGTWTLSPQLNTLPATDQQIAIDNIGDFYVTWQAWDGNHWRCQAASSQGINNWLLPAKDLSYIGSDAVSPAIATSAFGQTVFAWTLQGTGTTSGIIQAVYFDRTVPWATWTPVVTNLSDPSQQAQSPSISMDSVGNAIVSWQIFDGTNWRTQAAFYDAFKQAWRPLSATRTSNGYLSPAGIDAIAPHVSMGFQGYGIITYNLVEGQTQTSAVNFFTQQTQTVSEYSKTGITGTNLGDPLSVIDYNNGTAVINLAGPTSALSRQGSNSIIGVTLYMPPVGPTAPTGVKANQLLQRFPRQADLINILTWLPVANAAGYKVYADANFQQLLATVPATDNPQACFHCIKPCITSTYYIYAINSQGIYSTPTMITVPS